MRIQNTTTDSLCEDRKQKTTDNTSKQQTVCAGMKTTKHKQQTVYAQIKGKTIGTTDHNNIQFMDEKQKTREQKTVYVLINNFYLTCC